MEDQVMSEVKKTFAPEFINRLDEIIIFDELSDEDLMQIIDLQVNQLNEILTQHTLQIRLTEDAKKWLIEKTCGDRKYGARPLKRALQRNVEDELSESLIQGKLSKESLVEVYCEDDKLAFRSVGLEEIDDVLFEKI
jgi:ATP-dependent Clp protease ATP-binding subunit ClpC